MMTRKPIETAPISVWVLVYWEGGLPYEPQGGPWDYGQKGKAPPPAMVAIQEESGTWRSYSEDGGIYGCIPQPTHWAELP